MKDWLQSLGVLEIVIAVIIGLGSIVSAAYALEVHWNQQGEVENAIFCTMTNKEMYLEIKLTDICAKYRRPFPCTTNGMSDYDKATYNKYHKWLEDLQKQIGKKITG
jgi:hypothetical protein